MSLPSLPDHPWRLAPIWDEEETKVLQAYGQACREAALAELHVPEISFGNIVEPVYQFRQKPTWFDEDVEWTPWVDCSKATFDNLTSTDNWLYQVRKLYLHPPQPQATTPVPEGYALVPIEPTPKMIDATWHDNFVGMSDNARNARIYKAMLEAAQGEKP